MLHPNIETPWAGWSEDQRLYLVVPYSNPFRWLWRRRHMQTCLQHLRSLPNVVAYAVECAYGDRPHEVTEAGNPLDIQLRTDCEMFHKENLINVGVSHFPEGARYGGYVDGDFHFERWDFALEAIQMLQHYHFVQLFSSYQNLTPETATSHSGHAPYSVGRSFAWNFLHQNEFKRRHTKIRVTDPYYGLPVPQAGFPFGFAPGAPGGAWAWTMDAFSTVGGMLDTCIAGSGDWYMAFGLAGQSGSRLEDLHGGPAYVKSIRNWQKRAARLGDHHAKAPMGCVDNLALHYFHGAHKLRQYGSRWQILVEHAFDPGSDIHRDWQGLWRWSGNKPQLRDELRRMFIARNEDSNELGENQFV